jgi:hypothetical protein
MLLNTYKTKTNKITTATKPQPQQNRNFTPLHQIVTEAGVSTCICDQCKTKTTLQVSTEKKPDSAVLIPSEDGLKILIFSLLRCGLFGGDMADSGVFGRRTGASLADSGLLSWWARPSLVVDSSSFSFDDLEPPDRHREPRDSQHEPQGRWYEPPGSQYVPPDRQYMPRDRQHEPQDSLIAAASGPPPDCHYVPPDQRRPARAVRASGPPVRASGPPVRASGPPVRASGRPV